MEERAAHVQAPAVGAGEDERRDEIHRDPDEGDRDDDAAVHVRRRDETAHRRVDDAEHD